MENGDNQKEMLKRIALLRHNQPFNEWRELAVGDVIRQIDGQLMSPMDLTEANLKALIMYRNLVQALFYQIFDQIEAQMEIEK